MSFLETLNEALKSQREPVKSKKVELKIPQLDIPKWIENLKHGRESKFKKVSDTNLHKDPSDGFFFNYNPESNTYFESSTSFSFITGVRARRAGKSRWDWIPHRELKQVTHENYSVNNLNFIVDKRTRKIHLEKEWGGETGNKIIAGRITRPEQTRDAIKAAVHHHPELKNYTFVPKKQKVNEYIKAGAIVLETGGTMTAYFAALGDEMKEILKNGIKDDTKATSNYKLPIFFDKKEASDETKHMYDGTRLYHVIGIGEFTFSDPDLIEEDFGDKFKIVEGKSIPAKSIKLVKTNFKDYFNKSFSPVPTLNKLRETDLMKSWTLRWQQIFVARTDEEYEYFKNRQEREKYTKARRLKGEKKMWLWEHGKVAIGLKLREGPYILMFKPGTTKDDIDKFLATRWFEKRRLHQEMPWQLRDEEEFKNVGYEIYFQKKFRAPLTYMLIKSPFEEKWYKSAEDMLKALGREVHKTDEN